MWVCGFAVLLQFKVQVFAPGLAGTRSLEISADYSWKATVLGAHTAFKTLGEAFDFACKPRFLRVASNQLVAHCSASVWSEIVLNRLMKARLACVTRSVCD